MKFSLKANFFEHIVWSRFWSWSWGKIWNWSLVSILLLMLGWGFEVESLKSSQIVYVWLRIWSWCPVKILKMFDQDLCNNLCYDQNKLIWEAELNPRVRCAFGNVWSVPGPSSPFSRPSPFPRPRPPIPGMRPGPPAPRPLVGSWSPRSWLGATVPRPRDSQLECFPNK